MHLKNLELTQLRLLEAIANTGSLTSAAEEIGLSQSAASHSLARLRKQAGDALFVRTAARMRPTAYGEQLCASVCAALSILRDGLRDQDGFDPSTSRRSFTLLMSEAGQMTILPALLEHLRHEAPGITIQVKRVPEKSPGSPLEEGSVDLAIGHITTMTSGFRRRLLFQEHYACICCRDNQVFNEGLTLGDYKRAPHAIADASGMAHWLVDQQLEKHGITRQVGLLVPEFLALSFVIPGSPFIATLPSRVATRFSAFLPLRVLPPPVKFDPYDIFIFWHERSHKDPANKWLRATLAKLFDREAVSSRVPG